MSRYLITLTPVDKFFFGGETTFTRGKNSDNKDLQKFDELYSSYVVKSNSFPQQTSLLGMLRFLLLSNDKDLFADNKINAGKKNDVAKLIGPTSFNVDENSFSKMEFGKIKFVFPCFIQRKKEGDNEWEDLIYAPLDYSLEKVSFEKGWSLLDKKNDLIPIIEGYDAKKRLASQYIGCKTERIDESGLFKEDVRIGIDRDLNGKTKEGAYYKQIFYRFSDKYPISEEECKSHCLRFAFYADLDYDISSDQKFIVSLGGDNSRFILRAEEVADNSEIQLPAAYSNTKNFDNCYAKIVLISDAFIKKETVNQSIFGINDTVSFRFLTSDLNTENYYKFSGNKHLKRSEKKYNLYKRGSVFYFKDEDDVKNFETALKENKRFRQIGYNYYQTIKKIKL
jgi:CRISPR-associated protein Cmr3